MPEMNHSACVKGIKQYIIPVLKKEMHKGQAGRIGIIGGSIEYTGAPYYAAISALKCGADLSHVFCPPDAARVIKCYSPELIVHPLLTSDASCVDEITPWFDRLHSVVLGPGLGRDENMTPVIHSLIENVKQRNIPLIIDADGLHFMTLDSSAIESYGMAVLTPNIMEFQRLYESHVNRSLRRTADLVELKMQVQELSEKLGNVGVVLKGESDIISFGLEEPPLVCSAQGSVRRCGGQGDLLSGAMGTFCAWANSNPGDKQLTMESSLSLACFAACTLTKECSRRAYAAHQRSTTTVDMVNEIGPSFEHLFAQFDWKQAWKSNSVLLGSIVVTFAASTALTLLVLKKVPIVA